MKIATFNVNGINGRLPRLLDWLAESKPDVACLQELKAPDEQFPRGGDPRRGLRRVWHGQRAWNGVAILARGAEPIETRRGLPGDPDDDQSRYLEAAVDGVLVGCLYLPNGNPQPGPKFDYKLAWFERLIAHARKLLRLRPAGGAGGRLQRRADRRRHLQPALVAQRRAAAAREPRALTRRLLEQGWTDALRALHPDERDLHLLGLLAQPLAAQRRACASTTCC